MPFVEPSRQKQPNDPQHTARRGMAEQFASPEFVPSGLLIQRAKIDPQRMGATDVVYLQRVMGNHAVSRLLTTPPARVSHLPIQAKLQVGPVGDRYEQEADRVASEVMRKPVPQPTQRKARTGDERENVDGATVGVQRMPAPPKITPFVQRSGGAHGKGCGCPQCSTSVQRHHAGEEEQVQRHHGGEEEEVQRSSHGKGCKCTSCNNVQRHRKGGGAPHLQRSVPAKDGSFEADQGLEGRVKNLSGRGRPLDEPVRREMEGRFGGVSFGNVRIHTGAEANTLNRSMQANAFTHANNIAFADGKYNPNSNQGKHLLAHELTHNIQQTGGAQVQRDAHGRGCGCNHCRPATPKLSTPAQSMQKVSGALQRSGVIQRHASWEHRLLGDVEPDDLATLGQWQDPDPTTEDGEVDVVGSKVRKRNIKHIIMQEMNRLKAWQQHPPTGASQEDAEKLMGEDDEWQVQLVSIPSLGNPSMPPLIVTYGEMNTLADFYGSVDELKMADPTKRWNVAQSVRNQSFEKLLSVYMGLTKKTEKEAKEKLGVEGLTFTGSFDITDAIKGEVAQMMVDKKGQLDKYSAYGATLARNACHFAPESWHSWEDYHDKARKVAKEAFDIADKAEDTPEEDQTGEHLQLSSPMGEGALSSMLGMVGSMKLGGFNPLSPMSKPKTTVPKSSGGKTLKDKIDEKVNEALMINGFGDHYLQDSYAAGHLINKTQVMQWFVQWLDKNPEKLTYTSDTTWRQFQAMAYDQGGMVDSNQYKKSRVGRRTIKDKEVSTARNPQMVENTQESDSTNVGWEGRFEMLGLKIPQSIKANTPALKLMLWLQRNSGYLSSWTWKELKEKTKVPAPKGFFAKLVTKDTPRLELSEGQLQIALQDLLEDQIVYMSSGTRYDTGSLKRGEDVTLFEDDKKFELRKEYIVSTIGGGDFTKAASQAEGGNMAGLNKMMKATVYKDYVRFMQDAFLQKSTNALHDYYCVNGLKVLAADGHSVHKIYGDNNMLNKESSKGVKESAQTSRMSRDSILEIAANGVESPTKKTSAILKRFPAKVELDNGTQVSLAEWHNDGELQTIAETEVFPTLNTAKDFAAGMLSGKPLGAITKDENVHGGESF